MANTQPQLEECWTGETWGPDPYSLALEEFKIGQEIADKFRFLQELMATSIDAAVYSRQLHEQDRGFDLPIGAALGDPKTGLIYSGYARDRQVGQDLYHAEKMAIDHARFMEVETKGALLGVTVEPCHTCLDEIEEAGITTVSYALPRQALEGLGIIKSHKGFYAEELINEGRETGRFMDLDLFRMPASMGASTRPDPELFELCLELFDGFDRDPETKEVVFDKSSERNPTRLHLFREKVESHPVRHAPDLDHQLFVPSPEGDGNLEIVPINYPEAVILRNALKNVIEHDSAEE